MRKKFLCIDVFFQNFLVAGMSGNEKWKKNDADLSWATAQLYCEIIVCIVTWEQGRRSLGS